MQAGYGVNAWNRATVATLLRRNSDTMANHEYRLRLEQYVVSSLPWLGTVRWLGRMPTPNLLDTRLGPPRTLPIGIIQCVLRLYLVNLLPSPCGSAFIDLLIGTKRPRRAHGLR